MKSVLDSIELRMLRGVAYVRERNLERHMFKAKWNAVSIL